MHCCLLFKAPTGPPVLTCTSHIENLHSAKRFTGTDDWPRSAEPSAQTPKLHRLWADLSPSGVRRLQFRPFREAYKEELRRLRIWTATYAGSEIIPRVADLHYVACNALPGLGDRHAR